MNHPVEYIQGHNKPWYHSKEPLVIRDPDKYPPDSNYWKINARGVMQLLADLLGTEAYHDWAELVWPGETIDDKTWMQIYDQTSAAYSLAKWDGIRDLNKLAEAARAAI